MENIDELVLEMLRTHKGGTKFFDNLDEAIRNDENIIDNLMNSIPDNYDIIVSGKFGRVFTNYFHKKNHDDNRMVIAVNGSLRNKKSEVDDISYMDLEGKEFIFIDDSFYSGKTRNKIADELESNGAEIHSTHVIYDGSKNKRTTVFSLYRYYDKIAPEIDLPI